MISHSENFIFVHQRKCAGVSIGTALGFSASSPEWHLFNNGTQSEEWVDEADVVRRYFKFAVVRNPWDRFVSGWKYCGTTRERSLIDVLRHPPEDGHDYRHVTRPQYVTLYGINDELAVDLLIRHESLDEGFREALAAIGKEDVPLERHNVGHRPDYHDVFDAEARRLFADRFGEDIERFGYSF